MLSDLLKDDYSNLCIRMEDRILSTPPYMAYVRISDGCNNRCNYCAIPLIRGNFVSRDEDEIVEEVKELVKNGVIEIYPDFKICRSRDLMVRGKAFYAIWDKEAGLWSTDEYDVQRLIDQESKPFLYQSIGLFATTCAYTVSFLFKWVIICFCKYING